ncbi:4'-phosphopantetheinyl transferase superfamily protein [Variovorax sp. CAN2819]|uniref:4'-phosphopantetheinyl transferase family protein n=1 Tax=Variovorax sp. CAN15 TaxID=3046727 RepID=UPI002647B589|nr:4'-phosphopantetheinyl transferase superfamily protein [Variovorax sp. CAN15]MDN6882597.1 4'-phosphopantetheinyl transferase superfamily protein [Variovorax sp. CAN15]
MQLQIDPHQVHLWHLYVPEQDDPAADEAIMALLTPEEREKHGRFHFARDRRRYLMTRGLIRSLLSRYVPAVAPGNWRFENNEYGRPGIAHAPAQAQRIRFNISHSASLVVAALAVEREVGVDVEHTARNAPLEIAGHFFSAKEARALQRLSAGLQPSRFWDLWTLKESYIKARGMGLSIPLDRFSFDLDGGAGEAIGFEHGLEDDSAQRWRFWRLQPDDAHAVALCLERMKDESEVQIRCLKATPLLASVEEFQGTVTRRSADT